MASMPFHVKAVYEYSSEHDDDLSFSIGQVITVTEIEDDDWYVGHYTDAAGAKRDGLFPNNYVERYEPPAPPRPARPRPKKEPTPAAEPGPVARVEPATEPRAADVDEPPVATSQPEIARPEPVAPHAVEPPVSKPQPPKPAAAKPSAPEPAPKPGGNSFRDRIAAFNKPAAPPIAPKPASVSTSNFIKKPYVPPPPARDAYVPPPREQVQPQNAYRREEDPEIAERQAQAQKDAEEAGLVGDEQAEEEDAPKATSLKDRIAMLQKQQQEQAARRAEGAPKEKPSRPSKPRTESGEAVPTEDADHTLSKVASPDSAIEPQTGLSKKPSVRRPSHQSLEPPAREIPSDGNDADQSGAGDTTEDAGASSTEVDETDERSRRPVAHAVPSRTSTSGTRDPVAKEIEHEEEQEEDDEIDDETRRKEELRARMAKMSGGMGMAGFFGGPAPPPAKRPSGSSDKRAASVEAQSPPPPPQRVPMVPVPGMGVPPKVQSPDVDDVPRRASSIYPEDNDVLSANAPPVPQERPLPPPPSTAPRAAPPVPTAERPVPVPAEARAAPPPPPSHPPGAYEDEDSSTEATPMVEDASPSRAGPPLPSVSTNLPTRPGPQSPRQAPPVPSSAARGPMSPAEKRVSRPPPPVPGAMSLVTTGLVAEGRPPPPPPPAAAPPSRSSTMKDAAAARPSGDGESDYEGDYDTDIASAVPHKDALKAHEREPSIDEGTLSEDTSASSRPVAPPPAPPSQRAAPPPPPHQPPSRKSTDLSRAPPPAPPTRSPTAGADDDYDPYHYESVRAVPSKKTRMSSDVVQESDPSLYAVSPDEAPRRIAPPTMPPGQKHAVPPPLPPDHTDPPLPPMVEARQSVDVPRGSIDRRSMDAGGRPADGAMIARDVDLAESTQWWTAADMPPPVFQNRPDVLFEMEETKTSKRGGRSTISKDVYVLFQDYSQTVVTARFDSKDRSNNVILEQRHEPPPARLRQDQLEAAHSRYGQAVANAAAQKQNNTLGDGSPQALVHDLINTAAPNALKPIGTRAYGSLVYANMANASVQQLDEIRPGDIVSFRNARFQGKHGAMHAKYSLDVGKPEHVAVVMEWDGTKKKIRAWEQGREKERKVKVESFKVGDLRSGEVKVWRLVGRDFVGWEANA